MAPGTRLGPYEIIAPIGAGGMGEVYRARDTRLGRDVAVKVLPSDLSTDGDRLHRFEQEACAAGALNHPNILSIYDVGTHDGTPYVVSELLEGDTLRQRLGGATLAPRRVIDYALQIAHGLAAAHDKGIVHRDLKPENLFVTKDGRLKILDFGIAKLTGADDHKYSQSEILTRRVHTDPGKVIGTAGYMSPEQVRGLAADHRSDLFSLGAILYEMLSGTRAFHGESAVETMNAILKEDPPELSQTNQQIVPGLKRVVDHCLEKNREERFQSARDLAFALEALSGANSISGQTATAITLVGERPGRRERLPWITATMLLGLALLAALPFVIAYFRSAAPVEGHTARFFVFPPEKTSVIGGGQHISPDGTRLVFVGSTADGKRMLWTRPLDSLTAVPVPGTEDASNPFWSPDSRFVGFFASQLKLKKIDLNGGPAQTLADVQGAGGGTWNREGLIIFAKSPSDKLYRVSANGGPVSPVTTLDESRKETAHVYPYFLTDGRHFLYLARSSQKENTGIYVAALDSNERHLLINADASPAYAPPGYLLFLRERTLMAQAFDVSKLQLSGDPFPIAEQVGYNIITGRAFFSVSQTGVLTFLSNNAPLNQLTWFDRTGKLLSVIGEPAADLGLRLSPDEKRLAISRLDFQTGSADLWLIDLARNTPTRFTFDPANEVTPVWSPDGSRIAFGSNRNGLPSVFQKLSNGAGEDEVVFNFEQSTTPDDWSSDGRFILFGTITARTGNDLWVLPLFGDRKPAPLIQTEFIEIQGRFSQDGHWVAYTSNASGTFQVYVQSFPVSGGKWQVSTNGGAQPQWRRDGKELYYLTPDRKLMAVDVNGTGSNFTVGVPRVLFEARVPTTYPGGIGAPYYAVTGDGQRFIVDALTGESTSVPLTVVLNWTADLKK
jgi:serine/threonine protein kinase